MGQDEEEAVSRCGWHLESPGIRGGGRPRARRAEHQRRPGHVWSLCEHAQTGWDWRHGDTHTTATGAPEHSVGRPRVPSPRHTSGCSSTDGRKLRLASLEAGTCRPQGDCGCGGHTGSHKNTRSGNGATVGLRSEKSLAQGQWVNKDLDEKGHKGQVSPTMKALSLCGDSPRPPIRAMRATQNLKAKCSTT